jgi:hypothetical protein
LKRKEEEEDGKNNPDVFYIKMPAAASTHLFDQFNQKNVEVKGSLKLPLPTSPPACCLLATRQRLSRAKLYTPSHLGNLPAEVFHILASSAASSLMYSFLLLLLLLQRQRAFSSSTSSFPECRPLPPAHANQSTRVSFLSFPLTLNAAGAEGLTDRRTDATSSSTTI